jgi:hypothetical protein
MDGRIDKTGTLQVVADNEVVVDDDRALAARVMEDREIQTIRDECWKCTDLSQHPSQRV